MSKFLRIYGAIAAATLLVAGCAARPPLTTLDPSNTQTQVIRHEAKGNITVPLSMPALGDERGVQYAYNSNYINTVEVRLRDSLGNESVQYVVRNAYLNTSRSAGTVNVTFFNVLPGTFTLTVRTSHQRFLSDAGPVKYDGLRDVYFLDGDADDAFDSSETEIRVISGNRGSNFLVFAPAGLNVTDVLPWSMRSDTSTTAAGFGLGGATQSIVPGTSTTVNVNVRQSPRWASSIWSTVREVTAGEAVTLPVAALTDIQPGDQVAVTDPSGFALSNGIADVGSASLHAYGVTADTSVATISFTPTKATNSSVSAGATSWNLWLARGQAVGEIGYTSNYSNAPKLTVLPDIAAQANSRVFADATHLRPGTTGTVRYDLRDRFDNLVAGNVTGVNAVPLNTVRRANAGLDVDYSVVAYGYSQDPRNNLNPFIVPGRTSGTLAGGVYTQGTTAPEAVTRAATYSITLADGTSPTSFRVTRLEIPYSVYKANAGAFNAGLPHTYVINVQDPPTGTNKWISLRLNGGPTIASGSFATTARTFALPFIPSPNGTLPADIQPDQNPVVITSTAAPDSVQDNGIRMIVSDYGARRVSDFDVVQARILRDKTSFWTSNLTFWWQQ